MCLFQCQNVISATRGLSIKANTNDVCPVLCGEAEWSWGLLRWREQSPEGCFSTFGIKKKEGGGKLSSLLLSKWLQQRSTEGETLWRYREERVKRRERERENRSTQWRAWMQTHSSPHPWRVSLLAGLRLIYSNLAVRNKQLRSLHK